jgi:hypothetical protein
VAIPETSELEGNSKRRLKDDLLVPNTQMTEELFTHPPPFSKLKKQKLSIGATLLQV